MCSLFLMYDVTVVTSIVQRNLKHVCSLFDFSRWYEIFLHIRGDGWFKIRVGVEGLKQISHFKTIIRGTASSNS